MLSYPPSQSRQYLLLSHGSKLGLYFDVWQPLLPSKISYTFYQIGINDHFADSVYSL